jgi:hypothetical protein
MPRLSEITFCLPGTSESRTWLGELRSLLAEVEYATSAGSGETPAGGVDCLTLSPPSPSGARPVTVFKLAEMPAPEVTFDTGHAIGVADDRAHGARTPTAPLEIADLTSRLAGHVKRVDHTGVNLSASTTSPEQWRNLVSEIASASTMYRYPDGEEWPFVLPSTTDELVGDIRSFLVGREPRFELVYDQGQMRTEWQFALWTDLTRTEVETMFPEPEGIMPIGLEEIFRVVRIRHPWPNLGIRFDLCYRIEDSPSVWETGEWLVTEGGRIH